MSTAPTAPTSDCSSWDAPHYVYRAYDRADVLLYVGCTVNVKQRMRVHRSMSPWARYVDRLDVYPESMPRSDALTMEARLIVDLAPIFNRAMRPGDLFPAQQYLEQHGDGDLFIHPASRLNFRRFMPSWRDFGDREVWNEHYRDAAQAWNRLLNLTNRIRNDHQRECQRLIREPRGGR